MADTVGRDNAFATILSRPDRNTVDLANSEMKEMYRCWRSDQSLSTRLISTKVSDRWSVQTVNSDPSTKCLKCLIAMYIAESSLSNVLLRLWAALNRREKNANGYNTPSTRWWMQRATSTIRRCCWWKSGRDYVCAKRVADTKACRATETEEARLGTEEMSSLEAVRKVSCNGASRIVQRRINRW